MARRHGSVSDARRSRRPTGAARDAIGTERKHTTSSPWRAVGLSTPPTLSGLEILCRACHFKNHKPAARRAWDRLLARLRGRVRWDTRLARHQGR